MTPISLVEKPAGAPGRRISARERRGVRSRARRISHSDEARVRPIRLALLGCGNVGSAVARCIERTSVRPVGRGFIVVKALVRDVTRERGIDRTLLTTAA